MLVTHNFNYNGHAVIVQYDSKVCRLTLPLSSGNKRIFERVSFLEEDLTGEYKNTFVSYLQDSEGTYMNGRKEATFRVKNSDVIALENTIMSDHAYRVIAFNKRQTLNELCASLPELGCTNVMDGLLNNIDKSGRNGVRPFHQTTLEPVLPVFFTEIVTGETGQGLNDGTISVTVVDGLGGYTYSLDGGNETALAVIENLAPGEHTLRITGSDGGMSITKTITVEAFA